MDEQKKPRSREKRVVNEGKGVRKTGEGLGTGPVAPKESVQQSQQPFGQRPAGSGGLQESRHPSGQRPTGFGGAQQSQQPFGQRPAGFGGAQQGQQSFGQRPAGFGGAQQSQQPFGQRPTGFSGAQKSQQPFAQRPAGAGAQQGSTQYAAQPQQTGGGRRAGSQPASGMPQRSGGGGKLILIVIALVVLLGGGKLTGLFGGEEELPAASTGNGMQQSSGTYGSQTGSIGDSSEGGTLGNLLSSFLSSGGSSVYDYTGGTLSSMLSGGQGSTAGNTGTTSGSGNGDTQPDETVSSGAREKYTRILGKNKDTVTILVYLCGTDLESQNGMGTSDLKEMAKASLSDQVNLIVYTGGCRRWRNSVISSSVNQIYQVKNGGLFCLEENMGRGAMTSPDTLSTFIRYGAEHFPANRMELIFWDHGGGSVTGYGHDEKNSGSSMTLAGINTALKDGGVKFDFIGFDACLMATVENGIMLSQYADYMIASEETEPGVGWYYTNWLSKLSGNTSMPTLQVGRQIADDFVEVCGRQCRGQGTTLSVVDLAELMAAVPKELKEFSTDTTELIRNNDYQKISKARSNTREFAQSTRIDQIDLVHFARNMGTAEGRELADALEKAVKYNRTGGGIRNAYGLSIYFPYKRAGKVKQMVSTYQAIGMDEEYTRCIQEFASLEISGQVAGGTPAESIFGGGQTSAFPGLLNSLAGGGTVSSYPETSGDLTGLLSGLFGGGSSGGGSLLDLFSGRSITAESTADYLQQHHLDASLLNWQNGRITLPKSQWSLVTDVTRNLFVDDGKGYINMGSDNEFMLEGDSLTGEFDGTWISIERQPVSYFYMGTEENGDDYVITGYVPALLNSVRVNLILNFDNEHPYGYIAGAQKVYPDGETETQAKMMIRVGAGDRLQFLCDYYDYEGNYRDSYTLGDPITLNGEARIENTPVGDHPCRMNYCFTDIYQQQYWTPVLP